MPETIPALLIALVAVVPGMVATPAFERHVGTYAAEFPERVLRFVGGSALVFPFTAAMVWPFWRRVVHVAVPGVDGTTTFVNRLTTGGDVSPLWLLLPVALVGVPALLGTTAGRLWATWLRRHSDDTPLEDVRAWDWVFLDPAPKILVAKLRSGRWLAGVFGGNSYASPRAARSKDVYLEVALEVNDEGTLIRDENGRPVARRSSILFDGDDIELLEVVPFGGDDGE